MVLFSMIQQLDGIRLAPHLLEPSVNNSISAQLKRLLLLILLLLRASTSKLEKLCGNEESLYNESYY